MTTNAQKKAQKKYEDKRKKNRLPSIYLTDEENEIFERALKKSGDSKKATIILALASYINE